MRKFLLIFLMLIFGLPILAAPQSQVVRVGISDSAFKNFTYSEINLFATSECFIYERGGGLIAKISAQKPVKIQMKSNVFYIIQDGKTIDSQLANSLVFDCPNGLLGVVDLKRKGKQAFYHGAFELVKKSNADNRFCLVNLIEVEEYLKGVVPNEMPTRFGLEALKAQAVAARNYVLSPRTKAFKEFDVGDSVASQVYFGANTEETLATQAVKETEGIVALYNWDLILAQYSSTAGGYTESYENAFSDTKTKDFPSKGKPYLKAKPDMLATPRLDSEEEARHFYMTYPDAYDMKSPYYRWQRRWEKTELEKVLKENLPKQSATGFVKPKYDKDSDFGELKELKVKSRGESGKIIELEIVGTKGSYSVFKELVIRRLLTKDGKALPSANVVFEHLKNTSDELSMIEAYGGGFGHGVGMSQYGAGFMGNMLHKNFAEILQHYYTGIALGTVPVIVSADFSQSVVSQHFYTSKKSAAIIVDNRYGVGSLCVKINDENLVFDLEKKLNPAKRTETVDISPYVKKGLNTITYYYPKGENSKKALRLYVELVKNEPDTN